MATSSNMDTSADQPDFSKPWMHSDVVLDVEGQMIHVHRFVLAMWSPVFKKMFTSEFSKEKNLYPVRLPGKNASAIKELLLIIYPTVSEKGWKTVTNENYHFLFELADEYQMDAMKQKCEEFLIEKVTRASGNTVVDELRFAQTHKLQKLVQTIINKAVDELGLVEFKRHYMYYTNQIEPDIYKQIVEGMIKKA